MIVLWWLVDTAVRLTLLAGLTALTLWLLRVRSAETRLRAWTAVTAAAFVLPFLPDQWVIPITLGFTESTATSPLTGGASVTAVAGATANAELVPGVDEVRAMVAVYIAGVLALLARLASGWSWTRRLTADATAVAGHDFWESSLVHVPVTVGLLRPRVIVPHTWREWPEDMLASVLAHEDAHATRRDGVWLTIALLHRALHWVNPLAWWLPRHVAALSEQASDDAALVRGMAPTRYAEILLSFVTVVSTRHRRVAWIVAMARPSGRDTERRLDRVLTWKGRAEMSRSRLVILAVLLVAGSAAVYTATAANLSAFPPDSPALSRFTPMQFEATGTAQDRRYPVVVTQVPPKYTEAGRRQHIEGVVELDVVISPVGQVTSAKVRKSLDATYGLDEAAMAAVRQWHFVPPTLNGKAVASVALVQMEFRLDKAEPTQKSEPVVVQPVVTKRVDPKYTPEAMREKIQGKVTLLVNIDAKGVVTGATVAESLDAEHGLDTSAIDAVMQWSFLPGTIDGVAKPFSVKISMEFRLHD